MAADAWKAHAALLLVQLNYGAYHVIAKLALTGGINQLVFCVLRDVVALTILGPLAYMKDKYGILIIIPLSLQCIVRFSSWYERGPCLQCKLCFTVNRSEDWILLQFFQSTLL